MSIKAAPVISSRVRSLLATTILTMAAAALPLASLVPADSAIAATTATPCSELNQNGCTELSASPPQDTVAVPPNILLMLDDSGSMSWDVMPDWKYLPAPNWNNIYSNWNHFDPDAVLPLLDSSINGVYYNPTVSYTPPFKADGSQYPPADFDAAWVDGFNPATTVDISSYRGYYDSNDANYESSSVPYSITVARTNASPQRANRYCPNWTDGTSSKYPGYCYADSNGSYHPYDFYDTTNHDYYVAKCDSIEFVYDASDETCTPGISFFTYVTSDSSGVYTRHYVAKSPGDCAAVGLSSTVCDETAATRQNVANWFSYYRYRMLTAKSGLTIAFNKLNPLYRFGFASINGRAVGSIPSPRFTFSTYTKSDNKIAEVQPFGDGSTGTRKDQFWKWIVDEQPGSSTPLPQALQGAGKYYSSAQPWTMMSSDPGYSASNNSAIFSCRASYTILTTDGFWNGGVPNVGNVDNTNGNTYTPPAGTTYPINGYTAKAPFKDGYSNTLADVAMKYWATDLRSIPNRLPANPKDPAFWQHMTTYTMGMGFDPVGISPAGTTIDQIFAWARDGGGPASPFNIPGFAWPHPSADSVYNIADLAHAAVNGHGNFFSVKSPQDMAKGFAKALADIAARNVAPRPRNSNNSVIAAGSLTFSVGYNTGDWSGSFQSLIHQQIGGLPTVAWDAGAKLDQMHSSPAFSGRKMYSIAYDTATPTVSTPFLFDAANIPAFDASEKAALMTPAPVGADTLIKRVNYLQGDPSNEGTLYRVRNHLLGAVLRAQPVYVSYPNAAYSNFWPSGAPEALGTAETYDQYVVAQQNRVGVAYLAANDGMLHAFKAPTPTCTHFDNTTHECTSFVPGPDSGKELWSYIPRAVYKNLANLTGVGGFSFRPTVDDSPVSYDVFFNQKWHTILTGGVGIGGRGVYTLDVTDPTHFDASHVLWEFDSDKAIASSCVASFGDCKSSDLGFTSGQPNVARLHNGKWVVLVPNGYFPDCTKPDIPTADVTQCNAIAAEAPKDSAGVPYSALFVLDAETGDVLAELKTPTNISGVRSYGLSTPVVGDYDHDQIDDVGFAGDAQGNLWRFDFSGTTPASWKVTLAYRGLANAAQPITTRPRLMSDPSTNYFMVVFGTGKYLGVGDNTHNVVQALYGVRDQGPTGTSTDAYDINDLAPRYLHEIAGTGQFAGKTLRCLSPTSGGTCNGANAFSAPTSTQGGWYINLQVKDSTGTVTDAGERVVADPYAVFATEQVVFQTLITGKQGGDPCDPNLLGAYIVLDAATGAPGFPSSTTTPDGLVGQVISDPRIDGPVRPHLAPGGGNITFPGIGSTAFSLPFPTWRRRSWHQVDVGH